MAFKLVNDLGGNTPVIRKYRVTDNEAIKRGEALIFLSGKLTKAAAGGSVAAIATHDVTAGTDKECEVMIVTGSQVFEVKYTGTPDATFLAGMSTADLDTTGLLVNAADVVGGACSILSVDAVNSTCHVMFKNRQLN